MPTSSQVAVPQHPHSCNSPPSRSGCPCDDIFQHAEEAVTIKERLVREKAALPETLPERERQVVVAEGLRLSTASSRLFLMQRLLKDDEDANNRPYLKLAATSRQLRQLIGAEETRVSANGDREESLCAKHPPDPPRMACASRLLPNRAVGRRPFRHSTGVLTDYKMEVFDSIEALNEAFNLFFTHSTRLDSDACFHQFHHLVAEWTQSQEATDIDTLIKLRSDYLQAGQALLDADALDALDTASSVLTEMSDDEPTALLSTIEEADGEQQQQDVTAFRSLS